MSLDLGRVAYEAYMDQTGGRSLVTGDKLPEWPALNEAIREAWRYAASRVVIMSKYTPRDDAKGAS